MIAADISSQAGNTSTTGPDGGLFVPTGAATVATGAAVTVTGPGRTR